MKKILSIILVFLLAVSILPVYASNTVQSDKPTIPVLIVNNSYPDTRKSMAKLKSELPDVLMDQITNSLGTKYKIEQINNDYNIHDVASTEKNDLLDMFKETNYSTVMLVEFLPVQSAGLYCGDPLVIVHFKILDIKDKKYIYNGKLWTSKGNAYLGLKDLKPQIDIFLKDIFKL